ncbi:hypothetical protein B0J18DRAFT_221455 [Chaetomium sp. MPI-SDFR-AT-0129]|nr:hypothetical protein B0J18DRAFT_221455 [Chaetomium sp. MPI-SDFR-AT-0129]
MSTNDKPPRCYAFSTLNFHFSSACVSRPSRLSRPPPTARGQLAQSVSWKQGNYEVRPGALTCPRRPCPTSGKTPKHRVSERHTFLFLEPGIWFFRMEMKPRFFEDVFCPCGLCPPCLPRRLWIGWGLAMGEETKTSLRWQCDTYGKTIAGLGIGLPGPSTLGYRS